MQEQPADAATTTTTAAAPHSPLPPALTAVRHQPLEGSDAHSDRLFGAIESAGCVCCVCCIVYVVLSLI